MPLISKGNLSKASCNFPYIKEKKKKAASGQRGSGRRSWVRTKTKDVPPGHKHQAESWRAAPGSSSAAWGRREARRRRRRRRRRRQGSFLLQRHEPVTARAGGGSGRSPATPSAPGGGEPRSAEPRFALPSPPCRRRRRGAAAGWGERRVSPLLPPAAGPGSRWGAGGWGEKSGRRGPLLRERREGAGREAALPSGAGGFGLGDGARLGASRRPGPARPRCSGTPPSARPPGPGLVCGHCRGERPVGRGVRGSRPPPPTTLQLRRCRP